ncbi:N-acetyltransferase, partial [Bacteroidales bacterium OttesenSCG-928-L03]|nr:N-acetyltransferase [Bacteroidales bacterium OttesenSCG-928-L03]
MKKVSIKKVETKREMRDFVELTSRIYADCPYYVPDLEMDIRETFDPKNVALEYSDIQAFIAYDEAGNPIGRIAGIINHRANTK